MWEGAEIFFIFLEKKNIIKKSHFYLAMGADFTNSKFQI